MSKRKALASEAPKSRAQRPRLQPQPSTSPAQHVIGRNSAISLLLRLPAELRNEIWRYAYGDLTVHVRSSGQGRPKYYVCRSAHSMLDYYHMSLEGSSPDSRFRWNQEALNIPGLFSCCPREKELTRFTLPLVSKQYWCEASAIFLESVTFDFKFPRTFSMFMESSQISIPRIQNLAFEITVGFGPRWPAALTCKAIGKFRDLQGVQLRLSVSVVGPLGFPSDGIQFKRLTVPFQQWQLDAEKTGVLVFNRWEMPWPGRPSNLRAMAEKYRKGVLDHRARRKSRRRGKGED
ncbi:hypothetical protein P154DRAFT_522146 [Amniculicola lignicola CBS 123094]|uniref:DUF7730 domain-containing protein n=1 Tax=Amniculicola lignicola CBS 123094 TaxID=1392246 RepID=A0A6A5WP70_9PLEO|nr:hypothetical protein P154DRAFT_522146 [Amniculicola lignicola CBS 123094]